MTRPLTRAHYLNIASAAACGLLLALRSATAHAYLIAYEDFNYGQVGGDLHGSSDGGSFGFSNSWTGNTSYNVAGGSLNAPRDPLPQAGNSVSGVAYFENRGIDRTLTTPLGADNTSVYVSVLMEPRGILHQGEYGGWFALALRGSTDVFIGMNYSQSRYGLRIADTYSTSTVNAVVGKPVFLVLRMDFTEGVESAYLYVNPQPGGTEPTIASASQINLNFHSLSTVSLTGPGGSAFDSLRIGTSYADVSPAISDYLSDGDVDADDLGIWKQGFGMASGATRAQGDGNGDGKVDGNDFMLWQRQYGYQLPGGGPIATVPEPTSAGLLVLCLALVGMRRRSCDALN